MDVRWNPFGFQLHMVNCFFFMMLLLEIQQCWTLNVEGLALLEFRARIDSDPYGVLSNWNPNDRNPCTWSGVHCVDGKVQMLDLQGLSLGGILAPDLGNLINLKSLIWESSLKHLNKANSLLFRIKGRLLLFYDMFTRFKFAKGSLPIYGEKCCNDISGLEKSYISQNVQEIVNFVRRRLLQESSNLPAMPASGNAISEDVPTIPITRSSGAFPAIPNAKKQQYPPPPSSMSSPSNPPLHQSANSPVKVPHNQQLLDDGSFGELWKYAIVALMTIFLIIVATMLCKCRSQGVTTITPWKTGLSGQLQKAFITGAPKLNRPELETACEDFSNIIETFEEYTIFKGTLSSGVEIAVLSTAIVFSKDWAKCMEKSFRKKIDTLSRVNHKNFVNLLGYCEEEEPFTRMMVFEYAPNGTLFEHLHVKEFEHLDWNARMRIIMGISYCLQYMHHDLNPPVAHSNLQSSSVYLTDDHAAKIGEVCLTIDARFKSKTSIEDESEHSELPPLVDPETNVYSFGMLLIEIISGKLQCSEEGPLLNWASKYLDDKCNISKMVDPTLKSFKNDELDIICEVIQECINQDPRKRPTMREVTSKLREVIAISPEAATPRLSPLWWAELEILSVEGT